MQIQYVAFDNSISSPSQVQIHWLFKLCSSHKLNPTHYTTPPCFFPWLFFFCIFFFLLYPPYPLTKINIANLDCAGFRSAFRIEAEEEKWLPSLPGGSKAIELCTKLSAALQLQSLWISGCAFRRTGIYLSGLGLPDWPRCISFERGVRGVTFLRYPDEIKCS